MWEDYKEGGLMPSPPKNDDLSRAGLPVHRIDFVVRTPIRDHNFGTYVLLIG
jgi:hypothetical protein